jgi:sulfate adenylyltransferase subunit 1
MAEHLPPLRVATAGSVDDGKSTLLGRLLFDTKTLMTDQIAHVEEASRRRGHARTDLALVTDGLRAEREQGITIDVAWRYFATPKRRFVLADAPGHVEYTRNMVTAASQADVALVLVDVRTGLVDQTKRHLFVARLLGVQHIVVAVNKMDLVGFDHARFATVRDDVTRYLAGLPVRGDAPELAFFPVSALLGDNVATPSTATPWFDGTTLLAHLEQLAAHASAGPLRFPVQWVIRPQDDARPDYRGYAGRVASGTLRAGQDVIVWPSGRPTRVVAVETADGPLEEASAGKSCVVRLRDELSVGRGDLITVASEPPPACATEVIADLAWMHPTAPRPRETFVLKVGTREVRAAISELVAELDVTSGTMIPAGSAPTQNALVRARVTTFEPIVFDRYADSRQTGSFLLIDAATGATRAAGMIRDIEEPA